MVRLSLLQVAVGKQPHVSIYTHLIKPKYVFCLIAFGYENIIIYNIELSLVSLNKHNNCVLVSGLIVHFLSYTNKMTFILSVDEAIIPDPHQLCDDIEETLKLMKDVVIARGIVKENLIK